jgi:integrase
MQEMQAPWFRRQNRSWYVEHRGKQVRLGRDEHGATRKNPPPEIVEAWHRLGRTDGGKPKDILYADLAEKYLATLKHPKTREESKRQLDWFIAHIGRIKVSEMRVHHVTEYVRSKKTWNSTSQNVAIERITRVLNWGIAEGYIDDHRVHFQRGQKPRKRRRVVVVSDDHAEAIEAAAYPRLRALLRVLRLTGARPSELCNLTIDKLDLDSRVCYVWNKTREKTEVEWRPLYLPTEAIEIIKKQIACRTEGHVFISYYRGDPFNAHSLGRAVRRIRQELKLPENICPYGLRHSWASNAINRAKANPALVAKMLGHVGMEQIKVYFHPDHEAMRETIEQIEQATHKPGLMPGSPQT